ncbi:hypothetical protein [Janthinobacterium agaricidamnosum]|uniref:Uncharacterized protein n=1 Tax=Janthinobacterium agaricidamnosum NBRC 102515 = DSM 9628 TaxID=1349767 RepID=W0V4R1_9BURK|nr:hypothetical protein [Janthinobacterium agaricidamnosum]CDG82575.1 hypothetical protein GJA_1939 [Janthinobacterium agaricidamnosum NBRC 102515 = DSM 9628]
MAIDRIPASMPAPLITQRPDVSNALPLPGVVPPPVPLGPYLTPSPDAGTGPAQLSQQALDSLAASVKPDPGATARDSSAMQANQVFFTRQLVWRPPDAAQLGASWRVMVKTYGEQYAALQEQARGQHVPGNLFMADQQPALLREGPRPPLIMDAEAWRFAVYGWAGQRLMLRVLASDADQHAAPKRRHGKVALRLELVLEGLGRVLIQMEPVADGVLLELAASADGALRHLRLVLPDIAAAVQRAGLRIVRCRLNRELHASRVHNNFPMQAAAAALSPPLFRAMAEVALLLSRPAEDEPFEPATRAAATAAPIGAPEPEPVSKEVAAPMWYQDETDGQVEQVFALPAPAELLPPIDDIDEQD